MSRLVWSGGGIIVFLTVTGFYDLFCDSCSSSPKLTECLQKKKDVIDQMEVKLDTGIDRLVFCISLYTLLILICIFEANKILPLSESFSHVLKMSIHPKWSDFCSIIMNELELGCIL